jgi:hypothetical protein
MKKTKLGNWIGTSDKLPPKKKQQDGSGLMYWVALDNGAVELAVWEPRKGGTTYRFIPCLRRHGDLTPYAQFWQPFTIPAHPLQGLKELWEAIDSRKPFKPKVGDLIYVGSHYFLERGEDDVEGGLGRVTKVTEQTYGCFVTVAEHAGHSYNWEVLAKQQKEFKQTYGLQFGYNNPDLG